MTTTGSPIGWKWSAEASGWRPGSRARGYVESLRRSRFDTCPISKNDRIKIDRTNGKTTLQTLKAHGYKCGRSLRPCETALLHRR